MKEKYTPHLEKQFTDANIADQYQQSAQSASHHFKYSDPLAEDKHEPVKGLIHKYENRALIKVSYRCAAHCRFCTRIRQIGTAEGDLNSENIADIITYIREHKEITDIILSGGDPFYTPRQTLELLEQLQQIETVKVLRIGTRLPIHNPASFSATLIIELLNKIKVIAATKPFFILIHVEHPNELGPETLAVFKQLKGLGVTLLAQTVFLKGINDSYETLKTLFENLYWNGVIPYYIYRCDYVKGLEHFVCDIEKEIEIMTELRRTLSGIACPTYVVDVEGKGKIPVPLNFWQGIYNGSCFDFEGKEIKI